MAQVLYQNGSSVKVFGNDTETPLHGLALNGDLEMVQVFLEYGVDVDCPNRNGSTLLDYASRGSRRNDRYRVARLLIERGADPNTRGYGGFTPLHWASEAGRIETARLLIEHGANVEAKNNRGKTPLDVAQGDEMTKLLLELSAK